MKKVKIPRSELAKTFLRGRQKHPLDPKWNRLALEFNLLLSVFVERKAPKTTRRVSLSKL